MGSLSARFMRCWPRETSVNIAAGITKDEFVVRRVV
jgi:hypothetical protein